MNGFILKLLTSPHIVVSFCFSLHSDACMCLYTMGVVHILGIRVSVCTTLGSETKFCGIVHTHSCTHIS